MQIKPRNFSNRERKLAKGTDRLARDISRISFADAYRFAVGAITGTDRKSYNDYHRIRREVINVRVVDYLARKEAIFGASMVFERSGGSRTRQIYPFFSMSTIAFSEKSITCIREISLFYWRGISFFLSVRMCPFYDMR